MGTASLEELFSRYRDRGDAGAFSELYDETATEVLRVAMFLSRDAVAAEDLVQATYLAAIEGASGWDGVRPVLLWLLGILANQARWRNLRESRVPDAERVARPRAPPHVPRALRATRSWIRGRSAPDLEYHVALAGPDALPLDRLLRR